MKLVNQLNDEDNAIEAVTDADVGADAGAGADDLLFGEDVVMMDTPDPDEFAEEMEALQADGTWSEDGMEVVRHNINLFFKLFFFTCCSFHTLLDRMAICQWLTQMGLKIQRTQKQKVRWLQMKTAYS